MLRALGSSVRCWHNKWGALHLGWMSISAPLPVSMATSTAAGQGGMESCTDRRTNRMKAHVCRQMNRVYDVTVLTVTNWSWAAGHWGPDGGHVYAPADGRCVKSWRRWSQHSSLWRRKGQTCDQISANQVQTWSAEPASNLNMNGREKMNTLDIGSVALNQFWRT